MRPLILDPSRQIQQSIHYYLILSCTFKLMSSVLADTASDHLDISKKLLNAGKYSDALSHLNEAINLDPNNYLIYYERANVYVALNQLKSALDDLNKALELNQEFTSALSQRASLQVKLGNLDDPHEDHELFSSPKPDNNEAIMMYTKIERQKDELMKRKNYASAECAKVVETNPEAKKASYIINEMTDEYMLNPCKSKIWFVIELCESIQATHIKLANYELFSSTPKDFTVYFSDTYPALDWKMVGQFTATDSRTLQTFDLEQVGFGKFIRVELHSHYGSEHYCPINEVKVFGNSMVDDYEKAASLDINMELQRNGTSNLIKKSKRKTSAFKVYFNIMTQAYKCGLLQSMNPNKNKPRISNEKKELPTSIIQPQPTQQPVGNGTRTPLKPSIFTELSNKVKALESSLKIQKEEMERRLNETEVRFDKFTLEFRSSARIFALIVIAYCTYELMLDLM